MKVTFNAKDIETAPKDRSIMVFSCKGVWTLACWDCEDDSWDEGSPVQGIFIYPKRKCTEPKFWAEISEMIPK